MLDRDYLRVNGWVSLPFYPTYMVWWVWQGEVNVIHIYSTFQIDALHRHSQNLVGTLHATSLLCSRDMNTAVKIRVPILEAFWHSLLTIL